MAAINQCPAFNANAAIAGKTAGFPGASSFGSGFGGVRNAFGGYDAEVAAFEAANIANLAAFRGAAGSPFNYGANVAAWNGANVAGLPYGANLAALNAANIAALNGANFAGLPYGANLAAINGAVFNGLPYGAKIAALNAAAAGCPYSIAALNGANNAAAFNGFNGAPFNYGANIATLYAAAAAGCPTSIAALNGNPAALQEWSSFGANPWANNWGSSGAFGANSWANNWNNNVAGGAIGNGANLYNIAFRPAHAVEYFSLTNPIRVDNAGNRDLWLCYELKGFKPEEIVVTFNKAERAVIVEATHDVKDGKEHQVTRKFYRKFVLPDSTAKLDVTTVQLKSYFSPEGFLYIECALPKMTAEELARYPTRWAHTNELAFRRNVNGVYNNAYPITVKTA